MTLLEEIQNEAVDSSGDLGALLRKCKILAARLDSQPLEEWLIWESNGYPEDVEIPEYRIWQLDLKGDFWGPGGLREHNHSVPISLLPKEAQESYRRYKYTQSISGIEALLETTVGSSGFLHISTGSLRFTLKSLSKGYDCVELRALFPTGNLIEVLNTVRNRILDFALAIGKEYPEVGELKPQAPIALDTAVIKNIFYTKIVGGSGNFVGMANDSTVEFNITAGDFSSLEKALQGNDVSLDDIRELRSALDSDGRVESQGKIGPQVSSWMTKMLQKAGDGTWKVGVSAASRLLGEVVSKYIGL